MPAIAYTVLATFPDRALADAYILWLTTGHTEAVILGGASSASVVRVSDPADPPQVESRYVFPDRQAFDRYVSEIAPPLRADGLKRFGPDRGVRMERRIGEIVTSPTRTSPARPS